MHVAVCPSTESRDFKHEEEAPIFSMYEFCSYVLIILKSSVSLLLSSQRLVQVAVSSRQSVRQLSHVTLIMKKKLPFSYMNSAHMF